jgi:hypothetical protein
MKNPEKNAAQTDPMVPPQLDPNQKCDLIKHLGEVVLPDGKIWLITLDLRKLTLSGQVVPKEKVPPTARCCVPCQPPKPPNQCCGTCLIIGPDGKALEC